MPGWRRSTCLGDRAGHAGDSACCIREWGLLPCPPSQLVCRPHLLCWRIWYLALSSLSWEYLKSRPLDLAVMILQNSEPWERSCRCHPFPLRTQRRGCRSSDSRTSPCWGAAHWHEVNLILDTTSVLIWAESFGPLEKRYLKGIKINAWFYEFLKNISSIKRRNFPPKKLASVLPLTIITKC